MAYDPAEATERDRIRGLLLDTDATAIFADATYDSVLDRYDSWLDAGAEMAHRMALYLARRPASLTASDGTGVRWADRVTAVKLALDWFATQGASSRAGTVVTVEADWQTGYDEGDSTDG